MSNYSSFTEAVNAARAGRQDAFSWLYEQTSKEKYYIAIKYMKNQTDAADVLQDAYMKAWQRLGSLTEPEKFPGWVGQIVANTAMDALRKKKPLTFSDMSGENDEGEEFVYDIEDESIDRQPELNYTTNERSEIIRSLIDSLSDEQRMCVMMFYIEEMSVKEIAETLGVSENTVKSRLNYGRKNIKAEAEQLKKRGYNFYGIAPIPLLLLLLRAEKASAMGGAVAAGAAVGTVGSAGAAGISSGVSSFGQEVYRAPEAVSGMSSPGSSVAGASTAGTSAAGTAASAGFRGTIAGKIVIVAAIAATVGAISFGTYQVIKSSNDASREPITEQTAETGTPASGSAVSGPAGTTEPEVTPEPTEQPENWKEVYTQYVKKNKKKYKYYALQYINNDDTPELITFDDSNYLWNEYAKEFGSDRAPSIGLSPSLTVFTCTDDQIVNVKKEEDDRYHSIFWTSERYYPFKELRCREKHGYLAFIRTDYMWDWGKPTYSECEFSDQWDFIRMEDEEHNYKKPKNKNYKASKKVKMLSYKGILKKLKES